ncbi:hypothetical protein GCM10017764_22720 [Sphingobacterium griseoflavum]|uniref:Response regulatory domain-containing protein n=2 Tax=Sphingobacterium griseoflavum TaxID=1474952 RepID=A0ABQ3HZ68_9SPHI|nr:hypothetical protein GCM10017764_22720 [Sphingobacterium griseoflavum]
MVNLNTYSMAVIDSRPAYLQKLRDYFQESTAFHSIIAVGSIDEFYDHLGRQEFDIVLCGITPALQPVQALFRDLQSRSTANKTVLLAPLEQKADIFRGICFGATAFLPERLPLPIMEQRLLFHLQDNYWLHAELARQMLHYFEQQYVCTSGILHPLTEAEHALLLLVGEGACLQKVAEAHKHEENQIRSLVGGIFYKLHLIHRKERALSLCPVS